MDSLTYRYTFSHTAEREKKREKAIEERKKREEMVKWMRQHKQDRDNISERPPREEERGQSA